MKFEHKHILGIADLSRVDIEYLLDASDRFIELAKQPIKKLPDLRGKTIINLFYEDSTRTRTSFEIAGKRLSADVINISSKGSSVSKGESLLDTGKNLQAMQPDIIVCRHSSSGAPHILAKHLQAAIINAGDGAHEHPTQALLDMKTILQAKKRIDGLRVAIVGDIAHSRVARSNIYALQKLGASVAVVGPETMMPPAVKDLGVDVFTDLQKGLEGADVVMMLRIQLERIQRSPFPTLREYSKFYGLNAASAKFLKPDAVILHPGPVNRGVEISPEMADGPRSLIMNQVATGVAMRMTLLHILGTS